MPRSLETARGLCTIAACGHYGLEQLCAVALALSFAAMTKVCVGGCAGGVSRKKKKCPVPTPDERGEKDAIAFPSSVLETHMLHAYEAKPWH